MKFFEFMMNMKNEVEWKRFHDFLVNYEADSQMNKNFNDSRKHDLLIKFLNDLGLEKYIEELEYYRLSKTNDEYNGFMADKDNSGLGLLANYKKAQFHYKNIVNRIIEEVWEYGKYNFGWKEKIF